MLSKDFKEFVALLKEHGAEYMIVGGYAVGMHGYPRYTGDLDIWLKPTTSNAERVLKALHGFGFGGLNITVGDLTKEDNVIQLGQPPLRIDLLMSIDGVRFDECYANRKEETFDGLRMNFIGYHDLVKNKKASGRHRDLDDLENIPEP
ncbi:MAG: nucleotidyltransferase [Flavobacteriales bacterium]|nr:nucleotidyltransferase [Flavobacteriales bacterium]